MRKAIIVTIIVLAVLILSGLPRMLLFPVYREGMRLVQLVENYKNDYGTYPADLSQLRTEIKFNDQGGRGIRYALDEGRRGFVLTCYGMGGLREVYSSETKQWKSLK
jgi:hypothetical protein